MHRRLNIKNLWKINDITRQNKQMRLSMNETSYTQHEWILHIHVCIYMFTSNKWLCISIANSPIQNKLDKIDIPVSRLLHFPIFQIGRQYQYNLFSYLGWQRRCEAS